MITDAPAETVWRAGRPVDPLGTLAPLSRGGGDPAHRVDGDGVFWRATRTPSGPVTVALRHAGTDAVSASAWGPGAEWMLERVPDLLGARDDVTGFSPSGLVGQLWRRHPGLRVPRTGLVWDALVPAVLEQKVALAESHRSYRELVRRFGEPAPGPAGLMVPPAPKVLADLPSWEWHRAGLDGARVRTLRAAAVVADRLEEAAEMPVAEGMARLRVIPGIGPWTAAEVAQRAFGSADEVSVGDYRLSKLVGYALIGEPLDDAGMLEVLEQYRPHRHRVVRLLLTAKVPRPPRRAPKIKLRDYRAF